MKSGKLIRLNPKRHVTLLFELGRARPLQSWHTNSTRLSVLSMRLRQFYNSIDHCCILSLLIPFDIASPGQYQLLQPSTFIRLLTNSHAFMPSKSRSRRRICRCLQCHFHMSQNSLQKTIRPSPMKARPSKRPLHLCC